MKKYKADVTMNSISYVEVPPKEKINLADIKTKYCDTWSEARDYLLYYLDIKRTVLKHQIEAVQETYDYFKNLEAPMNERINLLPEEERNDQESNN